MGRRCGLLALGVLAAAAAQAHPHGSLHCAATLGAQAGRLAWVELRLTLDGNASQALRPRVKLAGEDSAPPQAAHFNRVLWGLLRQADWMLAVPAAGTGRALAWADGDSAQLTLDAAGRLQISVRLAPATPAEAPALHGLALECRDPTWYWLAGFADAGQLSSQGARCEVALGEMQSTRSQALTLQANAQAAGAPGADQMDPALAQDNAPRASQARLNCQPGGG